MNSHIIESFSGKSKNEKLAILSQQCNLNCVDLEQLVISRHPDKETASLLDKFSENTLAHHMLPFGIAPNFLVDGKIYHIPMVTEESSVVAAASAAAKFWANQGGFHTEIKTPQKSGHLHFFWNGNATQISVLETEIEEVMKQKCAHLTQKMEARGGGIYSAHILNLSDKIEYYYQLEVKFGTADSMGANFINSCLEEMAKHLPSFLEARTGIPAEVIMAILSNHNPESLVTVTTECPISAFSKLKGIDNAENFARRMKLAFDIATNDISRAVTHNKGIMNGIDAVILATANDSRAIEADIHAWAAIGGTYKALSSVKLNNSQFTLSMTLPLSVGTVGGVTTLHPLSQIALKILGNPDAITLMSIIASAGLASNFAAIKALVTQGIQHGHMKMHLSNILQALHANTAEAEKAKEWFRYKTINIREVELYLSNLRNESTY
jgi:hydroxymethylglutaryl-CoA reductase